MFFVKSKTYILEYIGFLLDKMKFNNEFSKEKNLVQKIKNNSLPYVTSLGLIFVGCANNTYLDQDNNHKNVIENKLKKIYQEKSFPGCESFDYHQFEFNANLVGRLYINGEETKSMGDKLAAFDKDGNCRGIGTATHYDLSNYNLDYISHELFIYSNDPGEKITFKAYDSFNNEISEIHETYDSFTPDDILADFLNPLNLHTK